VQRAAVPRRAVQVHVPEQERIALRPKGLHVTALLRRGSSSTAFRAKASSISTCSTYVHTLGVSESDLLSSMINAKEVYAVWPPCCTWEQQLTQSNATTQPSRTDTEAGCK
jgi:hypothetical protein